MRRNLMTDDTSNGCCRVGAAVHRADSQALATILRIHGTSGASIPHTIDMAHR